MEISIFLYIFAVQFHHLSFLHLIGALEHFLFFHILEIVIDIDFHISQRGFVNHQPVMLLHHSQPTGPRHQRLGCRGLRGASAEFAPHHGLPPWSLVRAADGGAGGLSAGDARTARPGTGTPRVSGWDEW